LEKSKIVSVVGAQFIEPTLFGFDKSNPYKSPMGKGKRVRGEEDRKSQIFVLTKQLFFCFDSLRDVV